MWCLYENGIVHNVKHSYVTKLSMTDYQADIISSFRFMAFSDPLCKISLQSLENGYVCSAEAEIYIEEFSQM